METSRMVTGPDKTASNQSVSGHAPAAARRFTGAAARFMLLVAMLAFAVGYMLVPRQAEQLAMFADAHQAAAVIAELETRLANGDRDPALLTSLSRAYEAIGNNQQAAVYLERYSAVRPTDSTFLLKLAELYQKAGNEPRCLAALERLMASAPGLRGAAALSEAYYRNGGVEEARALLSRYVKELTAENGLLLRLAEFHIAAGAKDDAIAVLMRGETDRRGAKGADNDHRRFLLARLLVQTNRSAGAVTLGKRWVREWREGWRAGKLLRIVAAGAPAADAIALADTVVEVHPETRLYFARELLGMGAPLAARHLVATWGDAHPDPSAPELAAFLTACRQLGEPEIVWRTFGKVLAGRPHEDVVIRYSEAIAAEFGIRALAPFWNNLPEGVVKRRPLLTARLLFDGQSIQATRYYLGLVDVSALEASDQQIWFDLLKAVASPQEVIAVLQKLRLEKRLPRKLLLQYAHFAGAYGREDELQAATTMLAQMGAEAAQ